MAAEQERAKGGEGEQRERREVSLTPQLLRGGRPPSGETAKRLDLDLSLAFFLKCK